MKKGIKISVMIPVYNTSKYLEKCLISVMNQSLKEIEIICVNDGSIDNSLEILEKFQEKDKRIIIVNKKNGGLTTARNAALKIASGEYCLNIDSDDWIEQGYLEAIYNRAIKDDLDIVISDIIFDFKNNPQENYILTDLAINDEKIITGEEYINIFLESNFYGYTWNKLIKRKIYVQNNIFYNEKIFYREDAEVILRLGYLSPKIGKVNRAYYHYIQGENNGVRKISEKKFYDLLNSFISVENFYLKFDKEIYLKIKRRKLFDLIYIVFNEKLEELDSYNKIIEVLQNEIKRNKFILKKNKRDSIKMVILFNILKIFNINSFIKKLIVVYKYFL